MGTAVKAFLTASLSLLLGFNAQAQRHAPTVSDEMSKMLQREGVPLVNSVQKLQHFSATIDNISNCKNDIPSSFFSNVLVDDFLEYSFLPTDVEYFVLHTDSVNGKLKGSCLSDAYYLVSDYNKDGKFDPDEIDARIKTHTTKSFPGGLSCKALWGYIAGINRDNYLGDYINDVTFTIADRLFPQRRSHKSEGNFLIALRGEKSLFFTTMGVSAHLPKREIVKKPAILPFAEPKAKKSPALPTPQPAPVAVVEKILPQPDSLKLSDNFAASFSPSVFKPETFLPDTTSHGFMRYPLMAYPANENEALKNILPPEEFARLREDDFVVAVHASRITGDTQTRFSPGYIYLVCRNKDGDTFAAPDEVWMTVEQKKQATKSFEIKDLKTGKSYTKTFSR